MRPLPRLLLVLTGSLLVAAASVLLLGVTLPKDTVGSHAALVDASCGDVFSLAENVARAPTWLPELADIEREAGATDRTRWRATFRDRPPRPLLTETLDDGSRLALHFPDDGRGSYGSWWVEMSARGARCRVEVLTRWHDETALLRVWHTYFIDPSTRAEDVLTGLQRAAEGDAAT